MIVIPQAFLPVILPDNRILGTIPLSPEVLFVGDETETDVEGVTIPVRRVQYTRATDLVPVDFMAADFSFAQANNGEHLSLPGFSTVEDNHTPNQWVLGNKDASQSQLTAFLANTQSFTEYELTQGWMYFSGDASRLVVPASTDWVFDAVTPFQIEFQILKQDENTAPRLFCIGGWPDTSFGVSLETGGSPDRLMVWLDGANYTVDTDWLGVGGVPPTFAIVRNSSSQLSFYKDGTRLAAPVTAADAPADSTTVMLIGTQYEEDPTGYIAGYVRNFHIMIGGTTIDPTEASYTVTTPEANAYSKLLLLAMDADTVSTDSSGTERDVANFSVTWAADTTG